MIVTYGQSTTDSVRALSQAYTWDEAKASTLVTNPGLDVRNTHFAAGLYGAKSAAQIRSITSGITAAATQITMNRTADAALETIREKLSRMRTLVGDIELGNQTEQGITIRDEEYQALAAEIDGLIANTQHEQTSLLSGEDALATLDLSDATGLDLTDLSDASILTVIAGIDRVDAARATLAVDLSLQVVALEALEVQLSALPANVGAIATIQDAAAELVAATTELMQDLPEAQLLATVSETSPLLALQLLS